MKTLADMTPAVNSAARDLLTHPITINGRTVRVQGDYGDGEIAAAGSMGIRQEIELMVLKSDLPTPLVANSIIILPAVPGKRFRPANITNSADGDHWVFNLVKLGT